MSRKTDKVEQVQLIYRFLQRKLHSFLDTII